MKNISALTLLISMAFGITSPAWAEEGHRSPDHKKPNFDLVFAEMQLSDEQQNELKGLLKDHHEDRRALGREAGREAHEALRDQHQLDLANFLTPEQLALFQEFRSQNRPPRRSK